MRNCSTTELRGLQNNTIWLVITICIEPPEGATLGWDNVILATPAGFEPTHYLKEPFIHKRATSAALSPFELQNTTRSIPFSCRILSCTSRYLACTFLVGTAWSPLIAVSDTHTTNSSYSLAVLRKFPQHYLLGRFLIIIPVSPTTLTLVPPLPKEQPEVKPPYGVTSQLTYMGLLPGGRVNNSISPFFRSP